MGAAMQLQDNGQAGGDRRKLTIPSQISRLAHALLRIGWYSWGVKKLLLFAVGAMVLPAQGPPRPDPNLIKPTLNNTIKLNAYADNWCMIYINGKLMATDSIEFLPHNVISVSILPSYPMTIAVLAKDNADPKTGLEYGTQIGDAGFSLKLSDGTVTSSAWKVKTFFKGPLNRNITNPQVEYTPIPANWFAPDFDDSGWAQATEYSEARVGPDGDYNAANFTGAKFIWSDDIDLDNTVIFRYTAQKPASFTKTWNADGDLNITNIVNDARLAPLTAPMLFQVNANGLATGYLTRVRGGQQLIEQFAQTPIDLGPAGDQVYLVLYGGNLPEVKTATATIGGVAATVAYAGALTPFNGVAQFNVLIPRALAGRGSSEVVITINGQASNPVTVNIQ